eukprot:493389-Pleurochrysis_carterae.AAC.1
MQYAQHCAHYVVAVNKLIEYHSRIIRIMRAQSVRLKYAMCAALCALRICGERMIDWASAHCEHNACAM